MEVQIPLPIPNASISFWVDAINDKHFGGKINHSCDPNCIAYVSTDEEGVPRLVIVAKKDIAAGHSLTLDYFPHKKILIEDDLAGYCFCKAKNCRFPPLSL